jgi:uncharacterized membrane protein YidH (DUF202 family)
MVTPSQGHARDGGLQLERTILAWQRTIVLACLVFVVLGRSAMSRPSIIGLLGPAATALLIVALMLGMMTRIREERTALPVVPMTATRGLLVCAAVVLMAFAVGFSLP